MLGFIIAITISVSFFLFKLFNWLFSSSGNDELKHEREAQRNEQERLRKIEQASKRQRAKEKSQEEMEDQEFELLVAELQSEGFTQSSQVSSYIIQNKLGNKYQNISGVLEMKNSSSTWKFKGGFPPKIYAMVCERLNLGNKGTDSKVTKFTSFKDLKNR
jgi:hypothetical protein